MSLHFSANQYDKNFQPTLLQNWEVPRSYREWMVNKGMRDCRPRAFSGFTQIVANNKGHLLPGVKRSRESPWGTFIGTWDMPLKIPGNNMTNSTARTENAVLRLERLKTDGDIVLGGKLKQCKVPPPLPVKADRDADKTLSPKNAAAATQLQSENGVRSGAMNPEPMTTAPAPVLSPAIRTPVKPCTPNIDWPRPASQRSRANSASPRCAGQKSPLPAIQPGTPVKADFKWPSPRACEDPVAA
ncbi:hypothetical protein ACF0H5_012292 [Mactra antiquata]